jgi:valyl-tRNA synthetase
MLETLNGVIRTATEALSAYDHAKALETAESFFWTFTDDYLELVKERAYNQDHPEQASAAAALNQALSVFLRLFAPVLPFAAEEAWSWFNDDSIHRSAWPAASKEPIGDPAILTASSDALIGIRRAKTEASASQKTEVITATIAAPEVQISLLRQSQDDLKAVGRIATLAFEEAAELSISHIELAPTE